MLRKNGPSCILNRCSLKYITVSLYYNQEKRHQPSHFLALNTRMSLTGSSFFMFCTFLPSKLCSRFYSLPLLCIFYTLLPSCTTIGILQFESSALHLERRFYNNVSNRSATNNVQIPKRQRSFVNCLSNILNEQLLNHAKPPLTIHLHTLASGCNAK